MSSCYRYSAEKLHRTQVLSCHLSGLLFEALGLTGITVIDWLLCDLVPQRGQTACRHQLRAKHRRAQSEGPGQSEWGECVSV